MKQYGSYSNADLDDWQKFPQVSSVLTSSAFGAWLMRRDENRDRSLGLIPNSVLEDIKADMVAMLTDIQSEIRHFMYDVNPSSSESDYACNYMIDIIQQKINSLKAEIEPQESEDTK